jgi:CD109 antigen
VEITSYGLLTYLLKGEGKLEDSVKISKWLLRHRNAEGGFLSTQDTVVGITALAKFAEAVSSKGEKGASTNVQVSFGKNGSHTFTIDQSNKIVMQEYFLPLNTREIDIKGNGSGSALAQLTWTYYVEETDSEPAFSLTADVI